MAASLKRLRHWQLNAAGLDRLCGWLLDPFMQGMRLTMTDTYLENAEPTPEEKMALTEEAPRATALQEYPGTIEHLAARRPLPPLDPDDRLVRQQLIRLRAAVTTLLTELRWESLSVQEAARHIVPLLDVGPLQQWAPLLVTHLLETDRSGNLLPVWQTIIAQGEPRELPPDGNPANTTQGRARRLAVLMLGNYKAPELSRLLGRLVLDPALSHYAAQALCKQNTTLAWQVLMAALKEAEGWALVDIIEACLSAKLSNFYDLLLAFGFERLRGLEQYVVPALYRAVPLERYLDPADAAPLPSRIGQNAALICYYVFLESIQSASVNPHSPPLAFERDLLPLMQALFSSTQREPCWQRVVALHQLATLLGRYWGGISRGAVREPQVVQPVMACLPLMSEVERWMNGPGRQVLLEAVLGDEEAAWMPVLRTLADLRELRVCSFLGERLTAVKRLESRQQAQRLALACEVLGQLGDGRALEQWRRLIVEVINSKERGSRAPRAEPLPSDDPQIPASILYVAILRGLALLRERSALDLCLQALSDFDPVVRAAALETLGQLDPMGEDRRSRLAMREALSEVALPVAAAACRLAAQYRDLDSIPALRYLFQARPGLREASAAALQQLEQPLL
jgi:HEAT repeat protein